MRIVDLDRQVEVVNQGRWARTFWTRLRGLLGTSALASGEGLLLDPCNSIHMFFMSYAIDAVYLDARNAVVHVAAHLAPWRVGPTLRRPQRSTGA